MTATVIYLVRHASHDQLGERLCGRTAGVGLSDAGRAEALRVGERLRAEGLGAVHSSPLQRAAETAEAVAAAAGVVAETRSELSELDFGAWSGRSWDELEADPDWVAWNADKGHRRPPGGETLLEGQLRMAGWLEQVRDRHPGERLAGVGHGEPIKAALLWVLGAPFDALARFEVRPASISVVVAGPWGFKVEGINGTA